MHDPYKCKTCQKDFLEEDGSYPIYKTWSAGASIHTNISKRCYRKLKKELEAAGWIINYGLMEAFER